MKKIKYEEMQMEKSVEIKDTAEVNQEKANSGKASYLNIQTGESSAPRLSIKNEKLAAIKEKNKKSINKYLT